MEFSWRILLWVMVCNFLYWGLGFLAQALDSRMPVRHSIISGTSQKFLHMQDLWRTGLADLIGVALIYTVFFHLVINGKLTLIHWLSFAAIAITSASLFLCHCLGENHKPDVGFPEVGRISLNGILHLPYLGCGIATAILCIWFGIAGDLRGSVLYLGLVGGVFYVILYVLEVRTGNFNPLKKVEWNGKFEDSVPVLFAKDWRPPKQ